MVLPRVLASTLLGNPSPLEMRSDHFTKDGQMGQVWSSSFRANLGWMGFLHHTPCLAAFECETRANLMNFTSKIPFVSTDELSSQHKPTQPWP